MKNSMAELTGRYEELKVLYPTAWEKQDWQALTMETNRVTLLSNPIEVCTQILMMLTINRNTVQSGINPGFLSGLTGSEQIQ